MLLLRGSISPCRHKVSCDLIDERRGKGGGERGGREGRKRERKVKGSSPFEKKRKRKKKRKEKKKEERKKREVLEWTEVLGVLKLGGVEC
jgi:hypothetical protein